MEGKFHYKLKIKIHEFVSFVYDLVKKFPKDERFGVISQLTRAAISVMLNYVEGFARKRNKVKLNFYEISYGSLQECKYIIFFAGTRKWITKSEYNEVLEMIEEISKMLWSTIDMIEKEIESEK